MTTKQVLYMMIWAGLIYLYLAHPPFQPEASDFVADEAMNQYFSKHSNAKVLGGWLVFHFITAIPAALALNPKSKKEMLIYLGIGGGITVIAIYLIQLLPYLAVLIT